MREDPPRYLGLDVGSKRIGVAVSDELGLTAQPVLTLWRKGTRDDLRSLARLCRRFGCAGVVAGLPIHLSGEQSAQSRKTEAFVQELATLTGIPIQLWDERLTSQEAHRILYQAGHPRQRHKPLVDQVAATLILQSFLDTQRDRPKNLPNHPQNPSGPAPNSSFDSIPGPGSEERPETDAESTR